MESICKKKTKKICKSAYPAVCVQNVHFVCHHLLMYITTTKKSIAYVNVYFSRKRCRHPYEGCTLVRATFLVVSLRI